MEKMQEMKAVMFKTYREIVKEAGKVVERMPEGKHRDEMRKEHLKLFAHMKEIESRAGYGC